MKLPAVRALSCEFHLIREGRTASWHAARCAPVSPRPASSALRNSTHRWRRSSRSASSPSGEEIRRHRPGIGRRNPVRGQPDRSGRSGRGAAWVGAGPVSADARRGDARGRGRTRTASLRGTPAPELDHFQPDCAGRKWSISLFDRMIPAPGTFRSARSCSSLVSGRRKARVAGEARVAPAPWTRTARPAVGQHFAERSPVTPGCAAPHLRGPTLTQPQPMRA